MSTFSRKITLFAALLLFVVHATAQQATDTTPERPKSYTVQQGDTLWDIAERFLFAPWMWKEVWHANPSIKDPHLIYPGDVVYLANIKGRPQLRLARGSTVKLVPSMRSTPIAEAIPAIPIDAIHPFLTRPYVMSAEELQSAPYVVAIDDERIIAGGDTRIYVRGIEAEEGQGMIVLREGEEYRDSRTGELLGVAAIWVGEARLARNGDPATLDVSEAAREIMAGDRIFLQADERAMHALYPKAPDSQIDAGLISVLGGVTQIGQYNVVVLDRGEEQGLAVGDVLQVDNKGATVRDSVSEDPWDEVTLPDEEAATMMIFRTFPKISFALIMRATQAVHVGDRAHNPTTLRY